MHRDAASVAFDAFDRLGSRDVPPFVAHPTPHPIAVHASWLRHRKLTQHSLPRGRCPLPRPSWDTSGFANPNRCSRGAIEGIETNSCITVVRPSRRAPRALLRMRYLLDHIKEEPHPEEAAKRLSRRTHDAGPRCPPKGSQPLRMSKPSIALRKFLILRKLRGGCLEGRTTLIQPSEIFHKL